MTTSHTMTASQELERWRVLMAQYRQWLAEFPDITLALDNLQAHVEGKALCASFPPSICGPWTIEGLRETLRRRHKSDDERSQS